jgi:cyclopropane-fatty-acyl-phospholipid synthase
VTCNAPKGLETYLRRNVRTGNLQITLPGGRRLQLGDGSGPPVAIGIASALWAARIALDSETAVGDAYMEGALVVERGDIYDVLEIAGRNFEHRRKPAGRLARWRQDWLLSRNARRQARRNVHEHYDLSNAFYRRFLDEDLQYSCAYFERPDESLEDAQAHKSRHIEAKLLLGEGLKVLDVGCGWGGLALRIARETGASVDGVTLSEEQLALARMRAEAAGMAGRVRFSLTDYRDVAGPYDRVVSVGMFEHVGRANFDAYFGQIARLLADDGVALVHSIGRSDGPGITQPWIAKHIFPGGYIPALSEALAAVERAGLYITDVEILRLHYAETLRAWRARFAAERAEVAALRGERFCRMWEFYLAASEIGFRYAGHMVFQLQLARRIDAAPITRGYIERAEQALSERWRSAA